jgi:chaperonin GroES
MHKEILVIGDRVLIEPDEGNDRTETGLYLPQGVKEKDKVQAGRVIKTGPGYPIPDPAAIEREPWQATEVDSRYFPLQAKEGDYCIFLRNSGIEIEFEKRTYVIVPHAAILVLVKDVA